MDLVIVTAWRRSDFLHACLSRLATADDGEVRYILAFDRHDDRARNTIVANAFTDRIGKDRVHVHRPNHRYKGNSYNVLSSYAIAVNTNADLVHLVEEDVFVGVDYLDFHRQAHALAPSAFSVSACRNQNVLEHPPRDPAAVWLDRDYQSIGVSFRRETLRLALREAGERYYRDPIGYCKRRFPNTKIPVANAEQDGLLNRIAEERGLSTVYPCEPRAYHAGFVGYHRAGESLTGADIFARGRALLAMTTEELNRRAASYPDHEAIDLDAQRGPVREIITWK